MIREFLGEEANLSSMNWLNLSIPLLTCRSGCSSCWKTTGCQGLPLLPLGIRRRPPFSKACWLCSLSPCPWWRSQPEFYGCRGRSHPIRQWDCWWSSGTGPWERRPRSNSIFGGCCLKSMLPLDVPQTPCFECSQHWKDHSHPYEVGNCLDDGEDNAHVR